VARIEGSEYMKPAKFYNLLFSQSTAQRVTFALEVVQVIKEGLKYVSVALGELSARTSGIRWMQVLFADSWDFLHLVHQPLKFCFCA